MYTSLLCKTDLKYKKLVGKASKSKISRLLICRMFSVIHLEEKRIIENGYDFFKRIAVMYHIGFAFFRPPFKAPVYD